MRRNGFWKKVCAGTLAVLLVLGNLSGISIPASARTAVFGGLGVKEADPATVNNWKAVYDGLNTSYAGGVWTDKSVFESAEAYLAATDEEESFTMELENPRDFLISLSAISSTKTIMGYSTLPIDTMFVLDVSGSMDSNSRDSRMVQAANKAIGDLLALNNYNRVGVVLYSSDATLLMPLDRYTTTSNTTFNNETIPSYIYLSNNDNVTVSNGVRNSDNRRPTGSREVVGATYIQDGIYTAMEELTDPDLDTVITEGFQVGTTRTPIMVLMSDGAPTYAVNTYTNIGSYNMGNGSANSTTPDMAFVTQLTASWAKEKIGEKYGDEVEPLFYTLGLGVGSDSNAISVMDPMNATASSTVNDYWSEFNGLNEGETLNLENHTYRQYGQTRYRQVTKLNDGVNNNNDTLPLSQNYVDQYFGASTSNDLSSAFQKIVDTIVLQTMYYPTLVEGSDVDHSGYLEFKDYIGPNMEVKQVEGVQLGDTLYTGEKFAQLVATGMGTVENPTDAGNELVWSLISRLQLGQIGDPAATQTAQDLLRKAWQAGQLAYNVDYDGNVTWSNWVGWYADANDKYLGFWDGDGIDADMVGKAAYAIKSYLVLGDVGEGHRDTDMLYASIQVRSALDAGGNVTEDIVYGKLPASLIPMVEYNVELNSNDPTTATEITLTKTGATAPTRLIYEVGLRSEIDLLNMEGTATEGLKTDANGNYIFYTNQWDTTGLEAGNHPNKLHNTYVNFFPSEENERYYYHEDMPIYVASGNGYVRYSGSKPAAGDGNTYYRAYVVYSASSNGGRATYTTQYQPIPAQALAADRVEQLEGTRNWVVKKGTLHLYEARTSVPKTANDTATLPYSEYPIVHNDVVIGYHLDAILGNNGLLTIDPPEGLKLTKVIDDTLTDNGQVYTFHIALTAGSHENAVIYLVTETDGVRSAWQEIPFADTYTIELAPGDSAWLAGLPEGNTYTVTEEVNGEYEVSSITVDGQQESEAVITARSNHIADVVFTNSAVFTGDVKISKTVDSSYAPHLTSDYAFSFAFELTGADTNTVYEALLVNADGSTSTANVHIETDDTGVAWFDCDLSHGQSLLIKDLPEGASVTATETLLPGFTCDQSNNMASVDVIIGETANLTFTNTYYAQPVSPTAVDVFAKKILQGRDWVDGDSFTFAVEKHVSHDQHSTIEEVTVDYYDADRTADFQSNSGEIYTEPGTYSYRVRELPGDLPGIAYDSAYCYFDIVVEDNGAGQLEIVDVIGHQDVNVDFDPTTNTWDVTTEFTNVYNSEGSVQVSLGVLKTMTDDAETGIRAEGYTFELYETDANFTIDGVVPTTVDTNSEGAAIFHDLVFTQEGTYYFLLKEATGNNGQMIYDPNVYYCTVDVSSDPETSGLVATATVTNSEGATCYDGTVSYDPATQVVPSLSYEAPFNNTYIPVDTETVIHGEKVLNGRDLNDGEFTFELYEAYLTDNGFVTGNYITETTNVGNTFSFEGLNELTYDKTGYYYYAVKEAAGSLGGVTYDEKTLYVTVQVVADLTQGTLVVNSVNVTDENGVSARLRFSNTYKAAATEATIEASKTMTGRLLAADMFQFQLLDASGAVLQTVANDGNGKVQFTVDYTTAGDHQYVIAERIPANATNNKLNGVTYDGSTWPVQVTVRDNLAGELVAEVSYPNGAPAFANDYTPYPTTAVISGIKTLDGRTQSTGEFTFELYETDARFVPVDNVADGTTSNYDAGNGTFGFSFGEKTYDQAGGYRYIIVERNTGDSQIDYDETVFYVLVSVTDNGNGQLVSNTIIGNAIDSNGTITATLSGMEFYNVFNHAPAQLTLTGNKILQDHDWTSEHTFTFELYEANEEFVVADGVQAVLTQNDPTLAGNEGLFSFPEMTFDEEGTYYYVIKEQLPAGVTEEAPRDDATGIIYDTKAHHVTVTVAEDPEDPTSLKATYTVDGGENGITFTNRYTAEGSVIATISGKKVLEGRMLHTDGFSFILKDADGNEVETVINNGDGTSNEGVFAFHPLTFEEAGTFTYTVEEAEGNVAGVTYSDIVYTVTIDVGHEDGKLLDPVVTYKADGKAVDEIVFTNVYKAGESEELTLEGTKTLVGGILKDIFTFELYAAEKNDDGVFVQGEKLDEVVNTGTKFTFDGLTYKEAGEYHYIIKEKPGTETGVTYDDNAFYVTVVVEDPGDGKLVAGVHQIEEKEHVAGVGIVFTNTFTPAPIPLTISGTKTLSGRAMQNGEFTFELYETGVDHVVAEDAQPVDTAVNADGTFSFDAISLDRVGSYYYVVKEAKGNASYVSYDATVYYVTATVTNNDGVLEKEVVYKVGTEEKTEIAFRNTYRKPDPQPKPIDVDLYVEKILKGRGYGPEGFVFELTDVDGDVIDTATSNRDGEAVLNVGTFRKSDAGKTYTYYIREVDTDLPGVSYSTREYKVKITVLYDSARNQLHYELVKDGVAVSDTEPFVFTNVFTPGGGYTENPEYPTPPYEPYEPDAPTSPDTGDAGIGHWIMLLAVSAVGFATTLLTMIVRKKRDKA